MRTANLRTGKWNLVEHQTWEAAVAAAGSEAATTMASVAPVIIYQQSERQLLVTSFPMPFIVDRVKVDTLKKGDDPEAHYNRPLIPDHVRAIVRYLVNQSSYILPPLTLCVEHNLSVHIPLSESVVKTGIIVLPHSVQFIVTDGQHRIRGIQEAFKQNAELMQDAIAVTIVNEQNIEKVHQDFVDCAQTKAISPALLTAFNVRDPLAKLVRAVATEVVTFKDRMERVAPSVGKHSVNIFTMNQLRMGVAELLIGDASQGQQALQSAVQERIPDDVMFDKHAKRICEFFRKFSAANPQWTELVIAAEKPAEDLVDTKDMRERFLHFNATGLAIIGKIGHSIMQKDPTEQDDLIKKLAELDWRRSAPMWVGNVMTSDGLVVNRRTSVGRAVILAKNEIGLHLTEAEVKRERMRLESEEQAVAEEGKPKDLATVGV